MRRRLLGQLEVVLGVSTTEVFVRAEPFERVLADRLEHPEPLPGVAKKALVHEALERVEIGTGDRLGCVQRAPAGEYCEAGEELLLVVGEKLVAPVDRGAQGLLARVAVAPTSEEVEAFRKALEDLCGGKNGDASGCELDRERQIVQCSAKCLDGVVRGQP